MKFTQEEISLLLRKLDVVKWDYMPLQQGKIKFYNKKNEKVAEGNFKIILSQGPGNSFDFAWNIFSYPTFPIIDKPALFQENTSSPSTATEAFRVALEIASEFEADFIHQTLRMYLAVFDFKEL
ncbi:MAG: hypothetical protein NW226_04460 [Microscillaceae bacterium]|nr:hypothetical protein [Microscillaceae bacterium]